MTVTGAAHQAVYFTEALRPWVKSQGVIQRAGTVVTWNPGTLTVVDNRDKVVVMEAPETLDAMIAATVAAAVEAERETAARSERAALTDLQRRILGGMGVNGRLAGVEDGTDAYEALSGLYARRYVRNVWNPQTRVNDWDLTEHGRAAYEALLPRPVDRCCDAGLRAECVCYLSTTCQEHGRICRGTHD